MTHCYLDRVAFELVEKAYREPGRHGTFSVSVFDWLESTSGQRVVTLIQCSPCRGACLKDIPLHRLRRSPSPSGGGFSRPDRLTADPPPEGEVAAHRADEGVFTARTPVRLIDHRAQTRCYPPDMLCRLHTVARKHLDQTVQIDGTPSRRKRARALAWYRPRSPRRGAFHGCGRRRCDRGGTAAPDRRSAGADPCGSHRSPSRAA